MGELIIKGDVKQLGVILKTASGRIKKYNLIASLNQNKQGIDPPAITIKKSELTSEENAELIAKCETLDDLMVYEWDTRQTAKSAYKKKLKELS